VYVFFYLCLQHGASQDPDNRDVEQLGLIRLCVMRLAWHIPIIWITSMHLLEGMSKKRHSHAHSLGNFKELKCYVFWTMDSSVAKIVLVYQRNIYHGAEQGIFTGRDKGVLLKADLNRSLFRKNYGLFYTRRIWMMKYFALLNTDNSPKEDGYYSVFKNQSRRPLSKLTSIALAGQAITQNSQALHLSLSNATVISGLSI
jgi:hypothetical protein